MDKNQIKLWMADWYKRNNANPEWKEQRNKQRAQKRRDNKRKAVEFMGDRCARCGESFPDCCYDFHHKDRSKKDFSVSEYTERRSKGGVLDGLLKLELDKCLLLCANCHRIEHDTLHGKKWNIKMPAKKIYTCKTCGNEKSTKETKNCFQCSLKQQKKIDWPEGQELHEMLKNHKTLVALSKILGVSDTAIRRRIKKYKVDAE